MKGEKDLLLDKFKEMMYIHPISIVLVQHLQFSRIVVAAIKSEKATLKIPGSMREPVEQHCEQAAGIRPI